MIILIIWGSSHKFNQSHKQNLFMWATLIELLRRRSFIFLKWNCCEYVQLLYCKSHALLAWKFADFANGKNHEINFKILHIFYNAKSVLYNKISKLKCPNSKIKLTVQCIFLNHTSAELKSGSKWFTVYCTRYACSIIKYIVCIPMSDFNLFLYNQGWHYSRG